MAGTLTISTLSDGTNSTSSTNCIQGSAKAWVNFNGTGTVAIRASYNVSSITDNGTGDYTVNFTTAMTDANYCVLSSQNIQDSSTFSQFFGVSTTTNTSYSLKSTTQVRFVVRNPIASNFDPFDVNVAIFR
jgi:hypothetical protein